MLKIAWMLCIGDHSKVGSDYRDQVSTSCRPVLFNSSRTEINPNLHNIYHYFLNISIISNRKRTSLFELPSTVGTCAMTLLPRSKTRWPQYMQTNTLQGSRLEASTVRGIMLVAAYDPTPFSVCGHWTGNLHSCWFVNRKKNYIPWYPVDAQDHPNIPYIIIKSTRLTTTEIREGNAGVYRDSTPCHYTLNELPYGQVPQFSWCVDGRKSWSENHASIPGPGYAGRLIILSSSTGLPTVKWYKLWNSKSLKPSISWTAHKL